MRPIYRYLSILIIAQFLLGSCKKLVQVGAPVSSLNTSSVYQSDATAAAVLTGIYSDMSGFGTTSGSGLNGFMTFFAGLSADEFSLYAEANNTNFIEYYKNALTSLTGINIWPNTYSLIYRCNVAIEGITASTQLTASIKQQLLGEAKFMRAFYYFYLVNLYGNVPLTLGTDYSVNTLLSRSSKDSVYQQIVADLKDAQQLLNENFYGGDITSTSPERVRPSKWAASALLSRVYLYTKKWSDAETQAGSVIDNTTLFNLSDLDHAFLKASSGNQEAIWQLQPVNQGRNTEDARVFILYPTGFSASQPVYLSGFVVNSFEAGDNRKKHWADTVTIGSTLYYFPYKYKIDSLNKPVVEYFTVLRLGEQFLIRAEARAQQNNISGALDDLNAIRHRAGLSDYAGAQDAASVLQAILHERQVELFAEWGHRWLDLKRTQTVDAVMSIVTPLKGGNWNTSWQYYPILNTDLLADPNLVQNKDY